MASSSRFPGPTFGLGSSLADAGVDSVGIPAAARPGIGGKVRGLWPWVVFSAIALSCDPTVLAAQVVAADSADALEPDSTRLVATRPVQPTARRIRDSADQGAASFADHKNKLTIDLFHVEMADAVNRADRWRARLQWDLSF